MGNIKQMNLVFKLGQILEGQSEQTTKNTTEPNKVLAECKKLIESNQKELDKCYKLLKQYKELVAEYEQLCSNTNKSSDAFQF